MTKATLLLLVCTASFCFAQNDLKSDIHLFQSFARDAYVTSGTFGECILGLSDYPNANTINLGFRGGIPISRNFELSAGLGFLNVNPEVGNGQSGLTDLRVIGKYHFEQRSATQFSVGGLLTLPIGKDQLGQGEGNFGIFGAARHPATSSTILTGVLAIDFLEGAPVGAGGWPSILIGGTDKEATIYLGAGVIQEINPNLHLIAELDLASEGQFGILSGGLDYALQSGGKLRGVLGLGMDDGAPDLSVVLGYMLYW